LLKVAGIFFEKNMDAKSLASSPLCILSLFILKKKKNAKTKILMAKGRNPFFNNCRYSPLVCFCGYVVFWHG
jgi:hypothetical protein